MGALPGARGLKLHPPHQGRPVLIGILSGTGAAACWAIGFVAARHGLDVGFSPADLTVHRLLWAGLLFLPLVLRLGIRDLGGVGWGPGIVLTLLGGPGLTLVSYSGFLLVPLGHGGVIQPSCAAVGGLLLATFVLKEKLPAQRLIGAGIIIGGLVVIGGEAVATIGAQGIVGDLMFVTAGFLFGTFGTLLRLWRVEPVRATAIISVLSLAGLPAYAAFIGFERMISIGLWENLLQAVAHGVLSGSGATYLFARSVVLLGASRAAVFPSLVPGFTLLIGLVALGEVPSFYQLLGFVIVLIGFRFAQKG
jgi:drug/metabolite transporter (DMT)-like permease